MSIVISDRLREKEKKNKKMYAFNDRPMNIIDRERIAVSIDRQMEIETAI